MNAAFVDRPEAVRMDQTGDPIPGPGEVVIAIKAAGVCGTDVHIYEGDFTCTYPLIPGHEIAGEIVEVGPQVDDLSPGQRVAVEPNVPCGRCFYCQRHQTHFCRNLQAYGVTLPGGFAERVAVRGENVYPIGDLSFEEGALLEPLGCVLHGIEWVRVEPGDEVLIFGLGPIGTLLSQVCKISGASTVVGIDLSPQKVEQARNLGLDEGMIAEGDVCHRITEGHPYGFDVVIDATGVPRVVEELPSYARYGGRILYFGVCPQHHPIQVDPFDVYRRELKILGTFSLVANFDRAIKLAHARMVNLGTLISHRFPLERFIDALGMKRQGGKAQKILIVPG